MKLVIRDESVGTATIELPDGTLNAAKTVLDNQNVFKFLDGMPDDIVERYMEGRFEVISKDDVEDYARDTFDMMTPDDFSSDWSQYVDECDIREYAEKYLDMLEIETFKHDWTAYIEESDIEEYASDELGLMSEDDAIEKIKEKLDRI